MNKKKSPENRRSRSFEICISESELTRLRENCGRSNCKNLSEYIRKVSLGDPVTIFYRNKSFDEFVEEVVLLRNQLQDLCARLPPEPRGYEVLILELIVKMKASINKLADYVRENSNYDKRRKDPGIQ